MIQHVYILVRAFLLFLYLSTSYSFAQSDHYWSQNFNTQSALLAGAVVGGNAGPSAVFYNPALINQDESHTFALSASLVSLQSITLENIAGAGTKYDNLLLQIQPKFLSYTGSPSKNKKIIYELAFLVPLTKQIKYNYFFENELDIIQRLDGEEDYTGEISYLNNYDDYYVGSGFSFILSDRVTIGASAFVSIKVMEYRSTLTIKAMQNTDTVYAQGEPEPFYFAQNALSESLKYWDISLIFKFGAHYHSANGKWGVGLNITFPNLSIYGEGDIKKEFYRSNIYNDNMGQFTQNLAFLNLQQNVRTNIKDPFSIAVGMQFKTSNQKNSIMLTAAYFNDIDEYAMLKTEDSKVIGNAQIDEVAEVMTFYTSAKSIFNFGFGYVQYINENLTINGGFKTDFNALTAGDQREFFNKEHKPKLSNINFDKFHIIAGPRLDVKKFGIVLGIQYTWGREDEMLNIANFTDAVEYNPLTNQALQGVRQNNMSVKYNEISLFFGLSYVFGK